jgi:hypothetical protein
MKGCDADVSADRAEVRKKPNKCAKARRKISGGVRLSGPAGRSRIQSGRAPGHDGAADGHVRVYCLTHVFAVVARTPDRSGRRSLP